MTPFVSLFVSAVTAILAYGLNLLYASIRQLGDIMLGSFRSDISYYYNRPLLIAAGFLLLFTICNAIWHCFFKK